MDSDSAKASVESMQDDPECIHVSNDSNLTGTCGDSSIAAEEGGGGGCDGVTVMKGIDAVDTAANSVPEMSDVVDAVSADLSPAENAGFVAQECGSLDLVGGSAAMEVVTLESSPVVGEGGEEGRVASMDSAADSPPNISEDNLEENKEEPPASDVNGDDSLREEGQQVVTDEKSSQAIENKLGQDTEAEKEKVDVMEEDTTAQAASLEDIVSVDIDIPDVKDVASVAGFTDISSQDKCLGDSVLSSGSEFLEEEPLKELEIGEDAKNLTDGDAKEDVNVTEGDMGDQLLKKTEEEEKPDDITVLEIKTKPLDVDDVAKAENDTQVGESSADQETVMDDVKEDVEKDPEAGKSVDIHVPEAASVETNVKYGDLVEKEGEGMTGVGGEEQTVDLEETRKLSEELAKVDDTKIAEASEETETVIRHEDEEKMDDMTDMAEDAKIHGDSSGLPKSLPPFLCKSRRGFFPFKGGNKGLCETCMDTIKLIEREEQEKKEPAQLDFDDKTSWESLFKDYWIDLKTQLSLSSEELDQAKSPQKGNKSHAGKQGTARETDYVTDEGSDSDSSPKKRKTRSRSKSGSAEKNQSPANKSSSGETWASKELLDVVAHMRRGDRSFLPSTEVHALLLDYIKKYNLRDPRRKSQVVCDSRLKNLFGKSHVGHFEMLNILDTHFLDKEQQQADNIQGGIVDTDPDYVDLDESLDHPVKSGKDKKRKTRKKGARKGRQSNLDDFAAVDMHNINLIYLRRSLVEDLLEDSTAFEEKVASAFVRLRISGNQKQDLYRLVQVVGTSKAPEPYKVGKKTTDYVLEILNLDKTEVISIDIISNQDFTEDECKRLRQSIKCGLINRLTVGDIQEKAIALQEVRVKNLLDAEILRIGHLRDRASDMGHRKEYPYLLNFLQCVEKLQLLKSPEERQRRLEEIPEIHADPKMDPDCESEDEDEKEEKEKEKNLRRRSSSFNRRGRDPISPRKGGFSSSESWTGTSNYSNTSANRELSRSYSGRGSTGRGIILVVLATRSSRAVVPPELSPRITPVISTPPPPVVPQPAPKSNESEKMWHYKDPSGKVQGPFSMAQLRKWNNTGYFPAKLEIWKANESSLDSVLLTDALAGLFQKQAQSVDHSYTKAYSGQLSQSEPNIGSSARTAPSVLDIPKNSQDTWSSGGSLPSPTPTQMTTPTAKGEILRVDGLLPSLLHSQLFSR
ncbi:hypothetical protein Bca52824_031759 [Brassica carinata]|uniref:Uncharacterized protein n=1 Tax=Brassica carinata TaxID=52824 RepID=A0A8X7SBH4_BRACI|nr:hypothetical protein Bca52824_031759 [Brassica carinata]